jgi:hypothetical protein
MTARVGVCFVMVQLVPQLETAAKRFLPRLLGVLSRPAIRSGKGCLSSHCHWQKERATPSGPRDGGLKAHGCCATETPSEPLYLAEDCTPYTGSRSAKPKTLLVPSAPRPTAPAPHTFQSAPPQSRCKDKDAPLAVNVMKAHIPELEFVECYFERHNG